MKVFLSWSGTNSHKVALILREWLPSVIQSIEPYVSSEDIDKGTRWSTDIAKELEDSNFGILCVTKENVNAPWLTFEAGALSKTIDKSYVSPFLYGVKRSEIDGPILQFQSTIVQKTDILKLLKSLNKACGEEQLAENLLERSFEVWYPRLKAQLDEIPKEEPTDKSVTNEVGDGVNNEILEEILELTRTQHKILRDPEEILPPTYLKHVFKRYSNASSNSNRRILTHPAYRELIRAYRDAQVFKHSILDKKTVPTKDVIEIINSISKHLEYIESRFNDRDVQNDEF